MSTIPVTANRHSHPDDAWACFCWPLEPDKGAEGQPIETVIGYFQTPTPDPLLRYRAAVSLRPAENGEWELVYSGDAVASNWRGEWNLLVKQAHDHLGQWLQVEPQAWGKFYG